MQNNNENALLVEYQAAQDSAQHHDNQIWSASSVIWTGNLVLLGLVFSSALASTNPLPLMPVIGLGSLALSLNVLVLVAALQSNWVKRQKYERCKKIEEMFDLHQHIDLHYRPGVQTFLYVAVMVLFLVAWIAVLWAAL